jgi:voltage-gated potassium channel Kch
MNESREGRPPLVERQVRRIADARSVTLGLAITFLALALVGAIGMRIVDARNFPSVGLAFWWALQTVTTVGYGDVVPTTPAGRVVGGLEMVLGVSFIAFLTAGVTSTVVRRGQTAAEEDERQREERDIQTLADALAQISQAMTDLNKRLDKMEASGR